MNKKIITFAALAAGAIGALGVSVTANQAQAGIVSPGHALAGAGQTSLVSKVNFQRRNVKRQHRRMNRHRTMRRHQARNHRGHWKHRRAWSHNRHWRKHRRFGSRLVGVNIARRNICAQYYSNAVTTGYRYWWNKYDACVWNYR